MPAHATPIPELEAVIERGSPQRRAMTLERITAFFLAGASRFNDEHVRLFDLVFSRLIARVETRARIDLSQRLAPLDNAPLEVVRRLALDDDIAVAGPILGRSRRLGEGELVALAKRKSQAHLLVVAGRGKIAEPVTDALLRHGQHAVAHRIAGNPDARLSDDGWLALISQAESDDALAEKVALRPDLPLRLLRELLRKITAAARRRLLASAPPSKQSEIRRALADTPSATAPRDYAAAQRMVEALRREGRLCEGVLVEFAREQQYGETIAALAALCAVPIEVVDRLIGAERPDATLILCRSAGWSWPTAEAIVTVLAGERGMSEQNLDAARVNFERLSPITARRVLRFWQVRGDVGREPTDDERRS